MFSMTMTPGSEDRWFHPLIARSNSRLHRRRLFALASTGIATAVAAPTLTLVSAQTPEASPASDLAHLATGDEDALALLRQAAQTMSDLDTFTFELETIQGESTILEGFTLEAITGAIRRPYDFTATVSVGVPFGTIDLTAVGTEGKAWIQNPLDDGAWVDLADAADVIALVNPDRLILSSIGVIQDAHIQDTEQVGGVETTRIAGTIDFAEAADQLGGGDIELPPEVSQSPIPVLIWIDPEHRVVEIEIEGPILTSESDDVIRSVTFADFNEPVEIEVPDV
jgi:hypothetical protein